MKDRNPQRMESHQTASHLSPVVSHFKRYTLLTVITAIIMRTRTDGEECAGWWFVVAIEIINSFIKFTMKLNHKMTNYENARSSTLLCSWALHTVGVRRRHTRHSHHIRRGTSTYMKTCYWDLMSAFASRSHCMPLKCYVICNKTYERRTHYSRHTSKWSYGVASVFVCDLRHSNRWAGRSHGLRQTQCQSKHTHSTHAACTQTMQDLSSSLCGLENLSPALCAENMRAVMRTRCDGQKLINSWRLKWSMEEEGVNHWRCQIFHPK